MDMLFTEDQLALAETVRDYLAGTHGPEVLRRLDVDGNRDPAIWQGLVEMGLTGLLIPEDQGGLGMGLADAALIAVECGRACLAEPLVETAFVAVPWLVAQGRTSELAAILAGTAKPDLPHAINPWLADGTGAALTSVDPLRNLAAAPADRSDDPLLLNLGALMSAAQLVGLADAMLAQAVDYAKIRTQFGQPIGAFQGLKHQLASCAVAIEFANRPAWLGHCRSPRKRYGWRCCDGSPCWPWPPIGEIEVAESQNDRPHSMHGAGHPGGWGLRPAQQQCRLVGTRTGAPREWPQWLARRGGVPQKTSAPTNEPREHPGCQSSRHCAGCH